MLPENNTIKYYTDESRTISVSGSGFVEVGQGKYSLEYNQDTRDWQLPHPSGETLSFEFEPPEYRGCARGGRTPPTLSPIVRFGWYDSYHFGGFVAHSDRQGNRSSFQQLVRTLREADWIDRFTRAVQVSIMVFNPISPP